ncbi:MAG TPA: adenylate/guanylate cyclase domain-containing protein, partial [Burkholderiales bacterium]|nr:adenylate/guanylate cyclase domain-containing protein [Burkholderiales bacterium]
MLPRFLTQWKTQDTDHRVWPAPFLGALAIGLVAGAFSALPFGQRLEQQVGLWGLFNLRGQAQAPPGVVVIAMRRDTGERVFLPQSRSRDDVCAGLRVDERPPTHRALGDVPERWGRCHYVELLRRLALAKPSAVVLDVSFRPRDDLGRREDRALAQAMRALGNVVLVQRLKIAEDGDGNPVADAPVEISREVAEAALGLAPMPLPILALDRYDEFWTFKEDGYAAPTLPALALQAHALDVYPQFVGSIQRVIPEAALEFPPSAAELTGDGHLHLHALSVRAVLRQFPERVPQLAQALQGARAGQTRRKLQALLSVYTGPSQRFLNLYGPQGAMTTISMTDILATPHTATSPDPLGLNGKVLFIGFADEKKWEVLEKFPTAMRGPGGGLSGVELAATAFANLLEGSSLQPTPVWLRASIAFTAGFATALVCYAMTAGLGTLIAVLGLGLYLLAAFLLFKDMQVWAPIFVPAALAAPVALAYAFVSKFLDIKRDRDALDEIMRKFVPSDMVGTLIANRTRLGTVKESTRAACVMTDVEGYTALSTRFAPAQMDALLSRYFAVLFEPVARNGGFVSDLKGDSILAIWADRGGEASVRVRVCDACLELRDAVDGFNAQHPDTPMPTRFGVNYGEVTLGAV